jgi:selT/selW/selH-like putative selenoprotein
LAEQIQSQFGLSSQLVKGHGGVFEVSVDDRLLFSKKKERRFPEPGEIEDQIAGLQLPD